MAPDFLLDPTLSLDTGSLDANTTERTMRMLPAVGTRDITQWLRALAALLENTNAVPSSMSDGSQYL